MPKLMITVAGGFLSTTAWAQVEAHEGDLFKRYGEKSHQADLGSGDAATSPAPSLHGHTLNK